MTPTEDLERLAASITPGPWAVNEINSGVTTTANDLPPCRTFGYGCGNDFVCDLNDGEYHEYTDGGEQEANARAIALLPELLAEAIATRHASGQRVKPLEWTEYETDGWADRADAEAGSFGVFYTIDIQTDGYRVVFDHEAVGAIGVFEDCDAAKAAAQADYEARVLSALEPAATNQNYDDPVSFYQKVWEMAARNMGFNEPAFPATPEAAAAGVHEEERRLGLDPDAARLLAASESADPVACALCEDNPKHPNIPCKVCGAHPQPLTVQAAAQVLLDSGELNDISGWTGRPHFSNMEYGPSTAAKFRDRLRALAAKGGQHE